MNRFIEEALLDKLEELEDIEDLTSIRCEPTRALAELIADLKLDGKREGRSGPRPGPRVLIREERDVTEVAEVPLQRAQGPRSRRRVPSGLSLK